ncbi:bifunctional DNA primase/polymerase [Mycolicibacterium alvei]|uniref:DNA primase/polymerase bifunctional N-terminal domain-containing protein n=1 Tax=Mycolicibacterium alvei TaxID=67081 RepID=A0A6N4UP32_9MYCO|nr:bifunctional DNA primase/polymerase [Mycolicibacterium alvei]MCV7001143.1 bifunctional DNA primase/polymerase [Mycolicibacterium alvei]BBX25397.1 hypothetical protein MALV_05220 [Mycolicibacterium alvei]
MTATENRPDAENVGPAQEAHNGNGATGNRTSRGYSCAQDEYLQRGWRGVLPLPPRSKTPPPSGFTGREGAWPSVEQLSQWAQIYPHDANLCLRLHEGTIGIDIDAYGSKTGAQTLDEAEKRWGVLPPTVNSSSRDDRVSGIRLYRVPVATELRDRIKFDDIGVGDIEILQRHHRYLICWPSVHPTTKAQYVWRDADGAVLPEPPSPEELPDLPEAWLSALKADPVRTETRSGSGRSGAPAYDVTDAMTGGRPTDKVAQRLGVALYELNTGTSRHDTVRGHILALLRFGSRGESGVEFALSSLYAAFSEAVGPDRPDGQAEAESEFARMVANAGRFLDDHDDTRDPFGARARRPAARNVDREAEPLVDDDQFWEQREILAHIRQFSRARLAAPHAVLGAVLRRALTLVEPTVQLPPIVGSAVSLNLFTVSVGRSGQGKDAANGVARDAVRFVTPDGELHSDPASAVGIGSGEGLARIFRGFGGEDSPPPHVNLEVNEIGTLGALADRKGSTLIGELLKGYMGQALGFTNAQRATTTFVPAHSYRLCLGVGAQPENGGLLLDREKDGFPQRFLWVPTVDPFGPTSTEDEPDEPAAADVVVPTFPTIITGTPYMVGIPPSVREAVRSLRRRANVGSADVDPLDGHLNLTRLKVSFGLALLDGRRDITEDDWRIAGQLVEVSNRTRACMRTALASRHKQANRARALDQADRQTLIDEHLADERQQRVWKTIDRKLQRVGTATRRQLQRACDSSIASDFAAVFDLAVDLGRLRAVGGDGDSAKYALGDR